MIVRTEAAGCTKEDLEADVERLRKDVAAHQDAYRKKAPRPAPRGSVPRSADGRDMYTDEVKEIIIDSEIGV